MNGLSACSVFICTWYERIRDRMNKGDVSGRIPQEFEREPKTQLRRASGS